MLVFSKVMIHTASKTRSIKGFTLLELIVAAAVSLTVLGVSLGMVTEMRRWMLGDRTRIVANDNLRIASDLIGQDIKQAGERLESDALLPGISIIPGASATDPSTLTLQRKLLAETLPVCQNIVAGTTTIDVSVVTGSAISNCLYSYAAPVTGELTALTTLKPTNNLRAWRTFRCTQNGSAAATTSDPCTTTTSSATAWAYIYDPLNKRGEFFQYSLEESGNCAHTSLPSRTCQRIKRVGSTWTYSYTFDPTTGDDDNQPKLYLLEQRQYSLTPDTSTNRNDDYILQLSVNDQPAQRIANQIRNFNVWAKVPNSFTLVPFKAPSTWGCAAGGSTGPNPAFSTQWYCSRFVGNSYSAASTSEISSGAKPLMDWQDLQGIRITLAGINPNSQLLNVDETSTNNALKLSSEFLPRNVASK